MTSKTEVKEYELLSLIVNNGLGSKVLKIAKHNGITGGTIFLGKGIVKSRLLELLELQDTRKEIVLMLAEKETGYKALEELNNELKLYKPNHGIAFSIPVQSILGAKNCECHNIKGSRGVEKNIMHNAIFVVVDKGKAEQVIEAAKEAGARGGTVINARGSGIHETSTLFSMPIEPEKEMVMVLAEATITDNITASIRDKLEIDKPGNGIIFVLDVSKTYGLR